MNYQNVLINITDEEEYEIYLDDVKIYKADNLFDLIEGFIWRTTSKEGNVIQIFRNYLSNYKELLTLCKEVM